MSLGAIMIYVPTLCVLDTYYTHSLCSVSDHSTDGSVDNYLILYKPYGGYMLSRCSCITLCHPAFYVSYVFNTLWTSVMLTFGCLE